MGFIQDSLLKTKGFVEIVDAKEGVGKLNLWANWLKCFVRYGATPSEWYVNEMYKYRHIHLKNIITRRKNIMLDHRLNNREFAQNFDNKVLFNQLYSDFVTRRWIYTGDKGITEEDIRDFIGLLGGTCVVKPIGLSSGRGIYLHSEDDDVSALVGSVLHKDYLLEERVRVCDELQRINPESCNTIRVYTVIDSNHEISIVGATFKAGGSASIQDNFHANGVLYSIDVDSGIISRPGKDLRGKEYIFHPSSGVQVVGLKIPKWDEVQRFVTKAADKNHQCRFIGWDVAVTADGCEMIEGNYYPSCNGLQIFKKEGAYPAIKSKI